MKRLLPIFVLAFGLFALWQAGDALAACWCENGNADGCRCDKRGTSPFEGEIGGIKVYCDSANEANSHDALKSPICGSSAERIPWCAYSANPPDDTFWVCWGGAFALGATNLDNVPRNHGEVAEGHDFDGPIVWNGVSFGGNKKLNYYLCAANLGCCGSKFCSDDGVPETPSSCEPQNQSIIPPVGICGLVPPGEEKGEGESRLWFSQTRLVAALASVAQTLFNPFGLDQNPSDGNYNMASFSKNTAPSDTSGVITNQGGVTSRVEQHQGEDDHTQSVNQPSNNSSVIINRHAPPVLFGVGNDKDNPYDDDRACYVENVKDRAGDDLAGPRIKSELLYTGEFTYEPAPRAPGCKKDGSTYLDFGPGCECCSKMCSDTANQCIVKNPFGEDCIVPLPFGATRKRCGTLDPVMIATKADIQIFDKTPLIEHIYSVLLSGTDSLYRRFMPQTDEEFEEIPTSTGFSVDVNLTHPSGGSIDVEYAEGQADSPRLYVPRVGTLDKYWLDEFQKSIRPKGYGRGEAPPSSGTGPGTPGDCQINCDQSVPDGAIPSAYLGTFKTRFIDLADRWVSVGGENNKARECYNDTVKRSVGAGVNPAFTLMIWLNESGASNYDSSNTSCITQDFGFNNPSIAANFDEQINGFLRLPVSYKATYNQCFNNGYTDMENFLHIFKSGPTTDLTGACVPDSSSITYHQNILGVWNFVAPGCNFPTYPTDSSCP